MKTEDPEYKIQIDRLSRELDELIEAQARIIESARHLIKLREALIRSIPDETARKNLRAGVAVIVPYLRAG